MRDQHFRSSESFLLVYDITNKKSFEKIDEYVKEIKNVKNNEHVPMVLVGNKCDLEYGREVEWETAFKYASKLNIPYFQISAQLNIRIEECFVELVREIRKQKLNMKKMKKIKYEEK